MTTIISNTEITSYNTCKRQHYYMYGMQIEPREYPIHIRRGEVGHSVLEQYYLYRKAGLNHTESLHFANEVILLELSETDPEDYETINMLADLSKLMAQYFIYYENDQFNIISVEKMISAPLIEDIDFGLYVDLIVEITTGPHRGEIVIWDHKFVNNFKSNDDLKLDGQQPKYVKTAQLNGIPVKRSIFNQIRYRKMKDPKPEDLFRRSPLISSKKAISTIWNESTTAAVEIAANTHPIRRTLSYSACKFCFFKDLCMTELAGEPVETMLKTNYKTRQRPLKEWMLSNN